MNLVQRITAACDAIGFKFDKAGINCVYLENGQMFSPALYSNDALKLLITARTLPKVAHIGLVLSVDNVKIVLFDAWGDKQLSCVELGDNIAQNIRDAVIDACIELGRVLNVAD